MPTQTTARRDPPRPAERFSYRYPAEPAEAGGEPEADARPDEDDAFNEAVGRILLAGG